ncbi:MAG: nitronate monooxygenase [Geminicoccaceae bacterium]
MVLRTRLTERLGLRHPIVSAPMGYVSGGALAGAVSGAGGLGLIGGGYGDAAWLQAQFAAAGNQAVGCGFITWSLAKQPELLDLVLDHEPRAVMLSFGDPAPFAGAIRDAGAVLILQVQTLAHARTALANGADIVVAQGTEAGGHGASRATMTLVPEVRDLCARERPEVLVLAAGGIADGRGLAAALTLGADGVLVGTRFYASSEALVSPAHKAAAVAADGDATVRTKTVDIVRRLDWPAPYDLRTLRNAFVARWHGREAALSADVDEAAERYAAAAARGDAAESGVLVGEGIGLVDEVRPAAEIVETMAAEAETALLTGAALIA